MVYDKPKKKQYFAINVFSCVADRKRIRRHKQNKSKVSRKLMNGGNKRRYMEWSDWSGPGVNKPYKLFMAFHYRLSKLDLLGLICG